MSLLNLMATRSGPSGPPIDIVDQIGWYMGDKGVTAPGNAISAVADQSANAKNLAGTGTLIPAGLNGLDYFEMDGATDLLYAAGVASGMTDLSMFIVRRLRATGSFPCVCSLDNTATFSMITHSGAQPQIFSPGFGAHSTASVIDTWEYISVILRGDGSQDIWLNGADQQSGTGTTVSAAVGLTLGARGGGSGGSLFAACDIAEAIFYDAAKDASRVAIEAYLAAKWGL